ncbi:MAG: trypsin-like serine protease [Gemmatimonadaceae bacterium]
MRFATTARAATTLALTAAVLACADVPAPTAPPGPRFVTNGTPTGSAYGNVGALLIDEDADGQIDFLCSGGLIAETVFLTAGHCVDFGPDAVYYVTFAPDVTPLPADLIQATAVVANPAFDPRTLFGDLAVVLLPEGSTAGITPLELPPEGYLDGLASEGSLRDRTSFINVGYGDEVVRPGQPLFLFDGLREAAPSPLQALTPNFLGLQTVASATGEGGACFGDSGSPKFVEGDPTLIVAVTSWGGRICQGTSWAYRLDIPEARAFLDDFVTLR